MHPLFIILLLLIVIYFIYKKSVVNKNAENVSTKEPPNKNAENVSIKEPLNKNVNLFSTLDKIKITKPIIETDGHYYMVKEITTSPDDITTNREKEYEFKNGDMYDNKVEARLFYDKKIEEIFVSKLAGDRKIELELYLIRNSNLVQGEKYILIDANGIENVENKKLESFLLSSMGSNKNVITASNEDSIYTKNSFLDSNYKD